MTKTIKDMWESYEREAIETVDLDDYTVSDIKDDFYSGVFACVCLLMQNIPVATIMAELKEYWND